MNEVDPAPINPLLELVHEVNGTDLHLTAGAPPLVRRDGVLLPLQGWEGRVYDAEVLEGVLMKMLGPKMAAEFENRKEIDFAFSYGDGARFRGNIYRQRGTVGCALRHIPTEIPSFEELGLPPYAEELGQLPQGLVLVTGPTGSGKSTTLAAIIDWINVNRRCHVLTIEDPIEYLHQHKNSAVNQREIGPDATDFHQALRSALREDPDVLLVGEMRDPESISVALSIAETGHLVFATLHTNDTAQALDRIIDVFPAERREQIQVQLASTLQAVVYQRLLPRTHGGLVAAFEILKANHPVRNLIREGKTRQLRNVVATSSGEGMHTLETSLTGLVADGIVDHEVALGYTLFPKEVHKRRIIPEADTPTNGDEPETGPVDAIDVVDPGAEVAPGGDEVAAVPESDAPAASAPAAKRGILRR